MKPGNGILWFCGLFVVVVGAGTHNLWAIWLAAGLTLLVLVGSLVRRW